MAKEVFVPKLGQTVEEVTIVKWLVEDGARIDQGQELFEVETDKAVFTVESNARGTLHIGPYPAGMVVPVLTVVAIIGKPEDQFVAPGAETAVTADETSVGPAPGSDAGARPLEEAAPAAGGKVFASPRARKLAAERAVDLRQVKPTGGEGTRVVERDVVSYLTLMPKVTPLAQKVATEAGVDLAQVTGTGQGGRITRSDVERTLGAEADLQPVEGDSALTALPAALPPLPAADVPEVTERVPLSGIRKIISQRMAASVHTSARVTLVMETDATEFVAMRERLKAKVSEEWGFAPGYNDLLARIVAGALQKFPYMNARITADAIEHLGHINMGMAVDTERGLLVPVIRDADRKSVRQFGAEFRQLVDRARIGRSLPDDLAGGTFTITNLGMFDVDAFTPVINLPEAAILGVGRIAPKWVYRADSPAQPVLRQMWTLCLVFDHRVVDGAPAARFLQYVKNVIEEPYLLLAI